MTIKLMRMRKKKIQENIKHYRERLLQHHREEFDKAVQENKGASKTCRVVDWTALVEMIVQLTGDIGKNQATRMLIHLTHLTAGGKFGSFDKEHLTFLDDEKMKDE